MRSNVLTAAQLGELQSLREEARELMEKQRPDLPAMLAGMALSEGGNEKVLEVLSKFYIEFQKSTKAMPAEFSRSISPDVLFEVESKALGYLYFDLYRPRGAWTLSSKKRETIKECNDEMDLRAWEAAISLKQVRSTIKYYESLR